MPLSFVDEFLSFLARLFWEKYIGDAIHSFEPNLSCLLLNPCVNLTPCGVTAASESSSYVSTEVSTTPRTPRTEPREGFTINFPMCTKYVKCYLHACKICKITYLSQEKDIYGKAFLTHAEKM